MSFPELFSFEPIAGFQLRDLTLCLRHLYHADIGCLDLLVGLYRDLWQ